MGKIDGRKMAKRAAGLTAREVKTIKTPGLHADGGGLYMQLAPTGAKTWIYRYQLRGRRRDMGLGSVSVFSLAEARQKAAEYRKLVAEKIDPIDRRAAQRAGLIAAGWKTFEECAREYISLHKVKWRSPLSLSAWEGSLSNYVYPIFGNRPIYEIDTALVLKVLTPIWLSKTETADRVRGRIENILDYAKVKGYRQGENPARWRGHLQMVLPAKSDIHKVEHFAALPYAELPQFMVKLRQQDGIAARALEFTILTVSRTGNVVTATGAKWPHFNLADRLWTIPAELMKGEREHRVPLSQPAYQIIEEMLAIRQNEFVFPGESGPDSPLSNMAMNATLDRMKRGDITVHGFRSTFRDWGSDCTSFPNELLEMALAHVVSNKVEAAYRRSDMFQKRRDLLDEWALYAWEGRAGVNSIPANNVTTP